MKLQGCRLDVLKNLNRSQFFLIKKKEPFLTSLGEHFGCSKCSQERPRSSSGKPQGSKVKDVSYEMHVFQDTFGAYLECFSSSGEAPGSSPTTLGVPSGTPNSNLGLPKCLSHARDARFYRECASRLHEKHIGDARGPQGTARDTARVPP